MFKFLLSICLSANSIRLTSRNFCNDHFVFNYTHYNDSRAISASDSVLYSVINATELDVNETAPESVNLDQNSTDSGVLVQNSTESAPNDEQPADFVNQNSTEPVVMDQNSTEPVA